MKAHSMRAHKGRVDSLHRRPTPIKLSKCSQASSRGQSSKLGGTPFCELVDRLLDKGIVIDVWDHKSFLGFDMLTLEAYVVVASIDKYLNYAEAIVQTAGIDRPQVLVAEVPEMGGVQHRSAS